MNYYVVLGIAEDADDQTIRSAFRALARRYHPDVGAGSSLIEFQRGREAYETLADPKHS
jgi:curved DNA-binding protein CbpA